MNSSLKCALGVFVVSSLLTAVACGSNEGNDPGGFVDDVNGSSGTSGTSGTSGSDPFGTSSGASGTSGTGRAKECAAQEATATLAKRPVDIIFVIDNSGSMEDEIVEVQKQVNLNFAPIIEASNIDYRVIMISKHGNANPDESVCIAAPLSGTSCSPLPAKPVETAKFFHHSLEIASKDAWCKMLTSFSVADEHQLHPQGWGALLRTGASKVIVGITDDRMSANCTVAGVARSFQDLDTVAGGVAAADAFDTALLALSPTHFGTAAKRNYIYHAIAGFNWIDTNDLTKAYPSTSPAQVATCGADSVNAGHGHQAIAMKTGGLRYPSCRKPGNLPPDYGPIFKEMAKGVVDGAKVSCEFAIPAAPAGQTLDLATVVPHYSPGTGGPGVDFGQVPNAGACAADKFYIDGGKIKLCPATCDVVQADPKAAIKVLFGCAVKGAN